MTSEVAVRPTTRSASTTAYRLLWLAVIFEAVADPRRGRELAFVVVAGICAPAVTGALDLYLRAHTP